MSVQVQCPRCERRYTLADNLSGKRIRCKDCGEIIEVKAAEPTAKPPNVPRDAVQSSPPPVRRRKWESADEDDDRPRRRSKNKRTQIKQAPVFLIVGTCCGLAVAVVVGVFIWMFTSAGKAKVAAPNPPRAQVKQAGNPPVPPPNAAVNRADPDPPGLYGDQGGDAIAPPDPHLPDTILRARSEDTFYRLSNPHIGQPKFGPGQALMVDYEITRRGKHGGGSLIIHGGDGRRTQVSLIIFGQQERGTIEVKTFGPFGSFPKHAELYMVRGDARYGPKAPTFKVSNSVTMGVMPVTTKARNWTKEEIERYTKEPPNYTAANVHPGVGRDTSWAGDATGGAALRYVEPHGLLLGLEFQLGEWDKEKCIGRVTPIFKRDQPTVLAKRLIAKDGYAVAGVQVHAGKYVDGIKLLFQRIKEDSALDVADSYASEWIGYTGTGQPRTLGNEGHRIVGIHVHQGAILNGLALVSEQAP